MNSTAIGDALEEQILALIKSEINADRFWAKKTCCKVFRKKGYHSKDRDAKIIFDVSIEIYLPGSTQYSLLILIECKNYTHAVPVDDAEEFFAKVQQVAAANVKAVVASTASFQSGTRAFAKSKGIGLLRYFSKSNFKWELYRSASASARTTSADASSRVEAGLSTPEFKSDVFDLYMQSPARETNSLWDFIEDLSVSSLLTSVQVRKVANSRSRLTSQVSFLEKGELEAIADDTLSQAGYSFGEVSLDAICAREADRCKLVVATDAPSLGSDEPNPILGRIAFDPLHIHVYAQPVPNRGRERFTLAHELAHHLLNHQQYMAGEFCDEGDFVLQRQRIDDGTDIARMEFQANYFAASLLMPRACFTADFWRVVSGLGLTDRGFGPLYVDNQRCNLQSFEVVTGHMMRMYGVSRTAAKIQLESLGLLRDVRGQGEARGMQAVLASAYDRYSSSVDPSHNENAI